MQPPQASRVNDIVTALVAAVGAAKDDQTTLLEGPSVGDIGLSDGIAIAVSDGQNPAVFARRTREPGYDRSYGEEVVIVCSVWSWSGSTDLAPRRARCAELLSMIQTTVAANRNLGGACDQLNVDGEQDWLPSQTTSGGSYAVGFTITATLTGA